MPCLCPQRDWSPEELLAAWTRRMQALGYSALPGSTRTGLDVMQAAGVDVFNGPAGFMSGGIYFSAWAPTFAVLIYKSWAARAASKEFTKPDLICLLRRMLCDLEAQQSIETLSALSSERDAVWEWVRESFIKGRRKLDLSDLGSPWSGSELHKGTKP